MSIARIDPTVKYISVGQLRRLAHEEVPAGTYVIHDNGEPLAVLVPYAVFLEMQDAAAKGAA